MIWISGDGRIHQLTSRAVGGVSGLAKHASDTEVTASVNGGREPVRLAFRLSVEAGEVRLVEDFLDLYRVGVVVQDSWEASSARVPLIEGANKLQSLTGHEVAAQA